MAYRQPPMTAPPQAFFRDASRKRKPATLPLGQIGANVARRQAAAAAASPVAGHDPSQDPFGDTIGNEGIYVSDLANLRAQDIADRAKRDAAIKALNYQYNDPSNPYATTALLGRQHGYDVADTTASRLARGVLSSGGTGLAQKKLGFDYGHQLYDAANQVNAQIGDLNQQYADAARGRFDQQQQYLSDATQRLIDAGIDPTTARAAAASAAGEANGGGAVPAPNRTPGTLAGLGSSYVNGPWNQNTMQIHETPLTGAQNAARNAAEAAQMRNAVTVPRWDYSKPASQQDPRLRRSGAVAAAQGKYRVQSLGTANPTRTRSGARSLY